METENFRSHITLKDGSKVRFVPPPPEGERLGGITQEERESLASLKGDLADKIDKPAVSDNNKFPRAKNGNVEWVEQGLPTDEQTATAVQNWLNTHPEATTTVQDGSIAEAKFTDELKIKTIKDYVTPEMFGAIGDGVSDDTAWIQDALDYAFDNKLPVYFAEKYLVTSPLDVHDWCYLFGGSNKTDGVSSIYFSPNNGTQDSPTSLFVCNDVNKKLYRHSFDNLYIAKKSKFCVCFDNTCPIDNGSFVKNCFITTFNIVFDCFIGHVSRIERNTFNSVMFAFHTRNLTDSYICNNYISGYRPSAPFCFYGGSISHSEVSNNFFDFFFGVFISCSNSKISSNIFDYCFFVFGYADAYDSRHAKDVQVNFASCSIIGNCFPNCSTCVSSTSGFGTVMSSIATAYLGEFKKEVMEGFPPCAIFVSQLTKNAEGVIVPKEYYYTISSIFAGNTFSNDGIILCCANTGGIYMQANHYGNYSSANGYMEHIPNVYIYITDSTNADARFIKTDIDVLRILPFKSFPGSEKHSVFAKKSILCLNYGSVYYSNKLITCIPDENRNRKWYDATGNVVTQ